jgi:hypothetical protein
MAQVFQSFRIDRIRSQKWGNYPSGQTHQNKTNGSGRHQQRADTSIRPLQKNGLV